MQLLQLSQTPSRMTFRQSCGSSLIRLSEWRRKRRKIEIAKHCFSYQFAGTDEGYIGALEWFSALKPVDVSSQEWDACITLFGEAAANVLSHATMPQHESLLNRVEVTFSHDMVQIKVWDRGPGFDFEAHVERLPESIPSWAEHGRGLWLMNKISDYMSYVSTKDESNCLTLKRKWG